MPDRGRSADKRLRLCRCPKGAAASREESGINASGDAEDKEVASTKAVGCGLDKPNTKGTLNIMIQRIELNPEVCGGRAVVRGTRITVETILGYLSAGDSINDVLEAHPNITKEDVLACLEFAQRVGSARSFSLAAA